MKLRLKVKSVKHRLIILKRAVTCVFTGQFYLDYETKKDTYTPFDSAPYKKVQKSTDQTFKFMDEFFKEVK